MYFNNRNKQENKRERTTFDKTISIRRVAKVTSGAKRLRFSAMIAVGDKNGSVSLALGRGADTKSAVEKARSKAEKTMKKIQLIGDTIPHEVRAKFSAARILLRPAKPGTGVIAGAASRSVLELAGIENVYAKQLGSSDLNANAYCTFEALKMLRNARVLKKMTIMQERVGIKAKTDQERKQKAMLKRKQNNDGRGRDDDKRGGRFHQRDSRFNRGTSTGPKTNEPKR